MNQIYRILYCSRNRVPLPLEQQAVEIRNILAKSRSNNSSRNITGALLFNGAAFAQVLEGPLEEVEATFEKIQRDLRHDEVAVLETGYTQGREFPEWSMAFAGSTQNESTAFAEFNLDDAMENPSAAAAEIRNLLRSLVVRDED
jgi:blue light- and temperature-responsive anti-repressor